MQFNFMTFLFVLSGSVRDYFVFLQMQAANPVPQPPNLED
jgi:hypothetical protein